MSVSMLPGDPSLDHLKHQAKDLLERLHTREPAALALAQEFHPQYRKNVPADATFQLADAQLLIARKYSFLSWPRLKKFVETYGQRTISEEAQQLRAALDANDIAAVTKLLDAQPEMINEHLERGEGYQNRRPLTYVCQRGKVELARLLLDRGADLHEDGNLPIARACLRDSNLPVVQLLVERGADVNCNVYNWGALILYPAECLAPSVLKFLLEKGADPNRVYPEGSCQMTAFEMVLGTYGRSPQQAECLNILIEHGAKFQDGPEMDIFRDRLDELRARIQKQPELLKQRFPHVNYGNTGARSMTAKGGTLLHIAAEWNKLEAARMLLDLGADVNAKAALDERGLGGQTALFHAVSQYNAIGLDMLKLLVERGADLTIRARIPGDYDKPGQVFEGTALGYGLRYPQQEFKTDQSEIEFLRSKGAPEEAKMSTLSLKDEFIKALQSDDLSNTRTLFKQRPELKQFLNAPLFEADQPAIVHFRRNRPKVDLLLNLGADIDVRSQFWGRTIGVLDDNTPEMVEYLKSRGALVEATPFVEAIKSGSVATTRKLLEQSPALRKKINACWFHFGATALITSKTHREMLDLLLEYGADLNVRSDWAMGSFGILDGSSTELAEYLIQRGATIDIHAACELGKFDLVQQMLAADPKLVHKKGGDGKRPLHVACSTQITNYLLDHGAEVDARCDDHHSTPIQYAAHQEWKIKLLLERGATPDVFIAARWGLLDVLSKILDTDSTALRARIGQDGYKPVPKGSIYQWELGFDLTPFQVALKYGQQAAYDLLQSRSGPVERFLNACMAADEPIARGILKEHPGLVAALPDADAQQIALAAWGNNFNAVKLMVELGFPINIHGPEASTALDRAACRGYVKIVEYLIAHGADLTARNTFGGYPLTACFWCSMNFRDPKGDYPATARALLKAGSVLPDNPLASPEVLAVVKEFKK